MIETLDDLMQWIESIGERHRKVDEVHCSCGWEGYESGHYKVSWNDHAKGGPIHDLADVLPSNTWDADSGPISCSQLAEDLYGMIDTHHQQSDELQNTLLAIALGEVEDPAALAAAVLCKMWPRSLWAECIRECGVQPDMSLADHVPGEDDQIASR